MNEDEKNKYKKKIKEIFNNSYAAVFSFFALVVFILSLLSFFKVGASVAILQQLFYSFSTGNLLFLGIIFSSSAILAHFKKYNLMFLPIVLWLLITAGIMRTSNIESLIDVSIGNYTLGPDLDPFLYLRNAIELSNGNANEIDSFRYAPLNQTPSYITNNLMPWAILWTYNFLSVFTETSVTYSAIILPVILFIISTIGFLLFAKTISSFKFSKEKSWIISLIATAFYIVIPTMLHRTVAGIPELESLGMVFFWFAFLFITLAWKENNKKKQILFGVLSGIFTGAMSWTWGGYRYIYLAIFLTTLLIFLFEKDKIKNGLIFSSWFLSAILLETLKVRSLTTAVSSLSDTALCLFLFLTICMDYILFESPLKNKFKLNKIKIPNPIKSFIVIILLGIIFGLIFSPEKIINIATSLIERLLYPFGRERVGLTVSENQAPYFTDVISNFGNLFWLFFLGVIILFYETIKHFNKKKKLILFSTFLVFITSFIFSRISSSSTILNGETIFSKILYLGGLILFAIVFLGIYISAYKNKDEKTIQDFKEIDFSYLLIISLSLLMIISMRGAIRLFFIISPFLILISAFLPVKIYDYWKNSKDSLMKMISIIGLVAIILTIISLFASYSASTTYGTETTIPSSYNQQWQYAMSWVRENTLVGSIFVHWWDYGYWVQTLGERPTVTDGGHYLGYWDHLTARYLLTTTKPEAALSLMKSYDVSYLLIDSTDLGKYSAFSKIGGDENYDTFSAIPTGTIDKTQTKETQNLTTTVYQTNGFVDEDINLNYNGEEIFIPGPTYDEYGNPSIKSYLIGIVLRNDKENNFYQPQAVFYYNNKQINLPIRYIYYNEELFDFGSGIESTVQIIPSLSSSSSGSLSLEEHGAAIYLSPKVSKSLFAQLYLLNDPMNKYPTVELAHSEQSALIKQMFSEGYYGGEFVYYSGTLYGPIKIWKVNYPSNILEHEEFLKSSGKYAGLDNLTFSTD